MTTTLARPGELAVHGLSWRPYGRDEPALREVSLTIAPGERVLLVGASGAGKSTLLRAMAGLLEPELGERQGEVSLSGEAPAGSPGAAALLLQDPAHSVVAEYAGRDAAFGPENRALPPPEVRDAAASALAEVAFPYGADHRTDALSGGELQRLALAGALALAPGVLLLDEPTAMLDRASAERVRTAVTRAADEHGLSLVIAEHRLAGWVDVCERLVVLGPEGRVLADGPTRSTLAEQAEILGRAGIWVPGLPTPTPLSITGARHGRRDAGLRCEQLTVTEPDGDRVLIGRLDLAVEPGESVAVLGPSGWGKTTLLRTLAGLVPARAGRVVVQADGAAAEPSTLARHPARLARAVAWLPQHADQVFTRRTVRDEVLATSEAVFADDPARLEAARADAETLMEALGLGALADADPFQLSGGEQRRVALAAVVAHRPAVVLLDEPTVGQDRLTWAAVAGLIAWLQDAGCVVVIATHDRLLAERVDRVIDLDRTPERVATCGGTVERDYRVAEVVEPGGAPTARCNPAATLVAGLAAAVGSFWVTDWRVGALTLVLSVLLAPLAIRRVRSLLRLVPVGIAAVMVGWSTILFSDRGFLAASAVPVAAAEATRICCLVVPGALLMTGLQPSRLADALAQRLHLPARPVVAAASALLRLQQLIASWRRMADVRRIRGLDPGRSFVGRARQITTMTFALLVSTLRSAQQMALSMDARGFAGARRRTYALGSPWRGRDWLCCLGAVVLCAAPIVLSGVLG